MNNYRNIDEKYCFSPTLQALVDTVKPRMKGWGTREGTHTGPEPCGIAPILEVFENNPDLPYIECHAKGIVASWLESPIIVYKEDLLVGVPRPRQLVLEHFSWGLDYDYAMLDHPSYADRLEEWETRLNKMKSRIIPKNFNAKNAEEERVFGAGKDKWEARDGLWWTGGYQGHTVPNYFRLLDRGIEGTLADIRKYACNTNDEEKLSLYRALETLLHGMTAYLLRYAEEAERMANESDDAEVKDRLLKVAENCRAVSFKRPATYYQAAQLVWMYSLWDWVDCVGRFDQYMYPLYKKSLETPDVFPSDDITASLFLKFMEHGVHNIPLGGVKPEDGTDATNDLSFMMLQFGRALHTTHPRMVARIHKDSPKEFMQLIVKMWSEGMSDPTLVSDELVIPALVEYGVSLEDARSYTTLGCQEIEIPGKSNFGCEDGQLNLAKIFEYTINDGCDRKTGIRVGLPTGHVTDYNTIEELWEAYMKQMRFFVKHWVTLCNLGQEVRAANVAKLVKTLFTDDCIARGKHLDEGGSIYNYGVMETAGAAAVADAFAAMDKLVFNEKLISKETLEAAIAANYEGYEKERQMLLNMAPKFGNDDDFVDGYMVRLLNELWGEIGKYKSVRGGVFTGACSLLSAGTTLGARTWAMPDGRVAGTELGNSIGPRTGSDKNGLTAMLNSVQKLPLNKGIGGTTLNVLIPKYLTATPEQRVKIEALMTAYMMNGGQMAQITTASKEDMLDAQKHPDCHGDLLIRIGGYSVRFVELDTWQQDEIIRRYGE